MSTMVWDEAGARYYETGVSRGVLFPIDGSPGVPWNGLVSVSLDPQGGEAEHYYFDGLKYMDRVLAEDFQATIQAISTPNEFRACEGTREYQPGVMTEFNKRDKFHMAWRTEISNDQGQSIAHKLHVAYNNLVQPSGRNYQTLADTTTMDLRNFTITATPACGRNSYFWFDSRQYDLSALEAQIATGVLPKCWELGGLVTPVGGGGGGGGVDPDEGCDFLVETFERYVHGQVVADDVATRNHDVVITGLINNGLDIIVLPAAGAFAANDSAASVVGTGSLTDDDDATYITSADGDLGYTVGLPPLVGYVSGAALELHIRMSISGGVNPDDPDNLDADAQVHISTDAGGDDTIGGFSDGADEGMGFSLSVVDGTPVDYVVPLYMDSWVDTSLLDVVTALKAGAYLNVVGASNNNFETTPEVRVYEASVVMLNDTDQDKWLRASDLTDHTSHAQLRIFTDDSQTTPLHASNTVSVDFKVLEIPLDAGFDGDTSQPIYWIGQVSPIPAMLQVEMVGGNPTLVLYDDVGGSVLGSLLLDAAEWYTVNIDWSWGNCHTSVAKRESLTTILLEDTHDVSGDPTAEVSFYVGTVGDSSRSYELAIDNARVQIHCRDEEVPWNCLDLSSAVFFSSLGDGDLEGQYDSGTGHIQSSLDHTGGTRRAQFHFPGFTLDPTRSYQFRATYAGSTFGLGIYQQNPAWVPPHWSSDALDLAFTSAEGAEAIVTVGPGIEQWDDAIAAGYQSLIRFDTSTNAADLISLCYKELPLA